VLLNKVIFFFSSKTMVAHIFLAYYLFTSLKCFKFQENMMLKEQIEGVMRENAILKRAVAIQHERQKEYEDKSREMQHLKQLVSQYQEQLRTLEVRVRTFPKKFTCLFQ
jgi:uncharacterized protein YlxW (UPF0749 family)